MTLLFKKSKSVVLTDIYERTLLNDLAIFSILHPQKHKRITTDGHIIAILNSKGTFNTLALNESIPFIKITTINN